MMNKDIRSNYCEDVVDEIHLWCSCGSNCGIMFYRWKDENLISIDWIRENRLNWRYRLRAAWYCIRGKIFEDVLIRKDQALELSKSLNEMANTIKDI